MVWWYACAHGSQWYDIYNVHVNFGAGHVTSPGLINANVELPGMLTNSGNEKLTI